MKRDWKLPPVPTPKVDTAKPSGDHLGHGHYIFGNILKNCGGLAHHHGVTNKSKSNWRSRANARPRVFKRSTWNRQN